MVSLETVIDPAPERRAEIGVPLRAFNLAQIQWSGPMGGYASFIKGEDGTSLGGLWGAFGFDWLFIELLVVPEALRGQGLGRQVMREAEAFARDKGLTGIWLDTFDFQARGFYEKLGYSVFGQMDDYPAGHVRYFLRKRLD